MFGTSRAVFSKPWKNLLVALLLFSLALALFWPATRYDFIDLDDGGYVEDNIQVSTGLPWENIRWAFTTVHQSWWLPILWLSFMADTELHGPDPFGYHLTNILLHALNTALLFWVLHRMTGARWRCAFVAALFAVHPLRVESVAWITERKDVLSGLFWMLAMLAYVRYTKRPTKGRYGLVPGLMLLGLMSKAILIALPPALLLLDYWPLRRAGPPWERDQRRTWGRLVVEKWPLWILSVIFIGINLATHESGRGSASELSLIERVGLIAPNYWVYLWKVIWPARLALLYPEEDVVYWPLFWAALAGLLLVTGWLLRTGKNRPWLTVGWLWFLLILFPVIRGVRMGLAQYADRFVYLPGIGLAVAVCWAAAEWASRRRPRAIAAGGAGLALILLLAARTAAYLPNWRNSESIFRYTLENTGENPIVSNNLGACLLDRGEYDKALKLFGDAVNTAGYNALPHFNMGAALYAMGRHREALAHFQEALQLDPEYVATYIRVGHAMLTLGLGREALPYFQQALAKEPRASLAHYSLGNAYYELGEYEKALEYYGETLKIAPKYTEGLYNQGNAFSKLGRYDEAIASFRSALALNTNHFAAHQNLGNVLVAAGRPREALPHYLEAVRIAPSNGSARLDLAAALQELGREKESLQAYAEAVRVDVAAATNVVRQADRLFAEAQYERAAARYRLALNARPEDAVAHHNLANALCALGRPAEALDVFEEALRRKPDYALAHFNLGNALHELGRFEEAAEHYRAALRLEPDNAAAALNLGRSLCALGRLEEGAAEFRYALERDPDYALAVANLADVLTQLGRTVEAEEILDLALARQKIRDNPADRAELEARRARLSP